MRLIAWNCNYNNRKRTFEKDVALLDHLDADILVLSEIQQPKETYDPNVFWAGKIGWPGLGVVARNGCQLTACATNVGAPTWFVGFEVSGTMPFNLLAAWPAKIATKDTYSELLNAGLDRFAEFLSAERAILAGDLNSSTRVSGQKRTHPMFVEKAQRLGLSSVYHSQTGEAHGNESRITFCQGRNPPRGFHIDYCFVSERLVAFSSVVILDGPDWGRRSDHFPVVLDTNHAEWMDIRPVSSLTVVR